VEEGTAQTNSARGTSTNALKSHVFLKGGSFLYSKGQGYQMFLGRKEMLHLRRRVDDLPVRGE